MSRKIIDPVPDDILQADLKSLCETALNCGATDAKIITASQVVIDERVRAKCMNPNCSRYGTNADCPPHAPDLDFVRRIVDNFHYGILIMTRYPKEDFDGLYNDAPKNKDALGSRKIIDQVEGQAFNFGYYLALGFADGPCKARFCADVECASLQGKGCRMGTKARSSMESWGMDAFLMATRVGWDVYPIGVKTKTDEVPHRVKLGLVLVY